MLNLFMPFYYSTIPKSITSKEGGLGDKPMNDIFNEKTVKVSDYDVRKN